MAVPYLMNGTRPRAVQRETVLGLSTPLALCASVTLVVGVGAAGWVVGAAAAVLVAVLVAVGLARRGDPVLRAADHVTLVRAGLACAVAGLTAESYLHAPRTAAVVALAAVGLLLDAVDGRVARRTGPTPLGARFDMEVDAFLILVLSVYVAPGHGLWVLLIGLARYALLVATWLVDWLARPTPPRRWAKAVAAVQGVVLVAVAADVLPSTVERALLLGALVLLAESFTHQVCWLWRHRGDEGADLRPLPSTAVTTP